MPNYDELIQQSQENVKALSEKLKELDKLHEDVKELLKQPEILNNKFQEIVEISSEYTENIGVSTKKYLDGNNILFTEKLKELDRKIGELRNEIDRLINTDFKKLFQELQKELIKQTREDLTAELIKFDEKANDLQIKINALKEQIDRLVAIDLEEHFKNLQKTLSDIFNAVNNINLTLTSITQTLIAITQSVGDILNDIDTYFGEITNNISSFQNETSSHLNKQDVIATNRFESIEVKLEGLKRQNILLNKNLKINKILLICEGVILIIILVFTVLKFLN